MQYRAFQTQVEAIAVAGSKSEDGSLTIEVTSPIFVTEVRDLAPEFTKSSPSQSDSFLGRINKKDAEFVAVVSSSVTTRADQVITVDGQQKTIEPTHRGWIYFDTVGETRALTDAEQAQVTVELERRRQSVASNKARYAGSRRENTPVNSAPTSAPVVGTWN